MPTYVYEVIPFESDAEPRRFEIFQRMSDPSLTADPVGGEPVRRVITGGIGIRLGVLRRSTVVDKRSAAATACGCTVGMTHRHSTGARAPRRLGS